jgi:hypothetical protein
VGELEVLRTAVRSVRSERHHHAAVDRAGLRAVEDLVDVFQTVGRVVRPGGRPISSKSLLDWLRSL